MHHHHRRRHHVLLVLLLLLLYLLLYLLNLLLVLLLHAACVNIDIICIWPPCCDDLERLLITSPSILEAEALGFLDLLFFVL